MNGKEQKERQTAVAILERRIASMDKDVHDLFSAELDSRLKGDEALRDEFTASLIAALKAGQTDIEKAKEELRDEFIGSISAEGHARLRAESRVNDSQEMFFKSIREMKWWTRIKWTFFMGRGY